MTTASKSNGEDKVEMPGRGPEDWVKPACSLAKVCGLEGHICGGLHCVKTLEKLGFYSRFGSLESLLNIEQKYEMVTTISVEVFPGVLQTKQKYIGKLREAIEAKINIKHV